MIKSILIHTSVLFMLLSTHASAQHPSGLKTGDKAPMFSAIDQFKKPFHLADQLKKGPVVMIFYRGHWCKYCNRQLENLSDSIGLIIDKGASVVTVTPEIMEFIDETSKKYKATFKIISDVDMQIMKAYKVNFKVKTSTLTKYRFAGINLNEFNGENGTNLPVPATFIIQPDGNISYVFFNEDYKKRVSMREVIQNL